MIRNNILNKKKLNNYKIQAISLKANIYIGKNGLTSGILNEIKKQLYLKKLIKIKVFKQRDINEIKNIALNIIEFCKANIINIIGHTIVLYKK